MVTYIVNGTVVDPNGKPVDLPLPVEEAVTPTPLPEDFPSRAELVAAGLTTIEEVKTAKDLAGLPGIGKANATKILKTLVGLD